jgi:hypothetical protein
MQLSGGTPHVRAGQCGLRETRQQFQIGRRCTGPGGLTVCDGRPGGGGVVGACHLLSPTPRCDGIHSPESDVRSGDANGGKAAP